MSKIITIEELAQIESNPNLKNDPKANAFIDMANDWVEHYTNQIFGEIKTKTKKLDYSPAIFLEPNIKEIITLTIDRQEAPYQLNNDTGRIRLPLRQSEYSEVEIQYRVGTETIPADLKMATLNLAREMMNKPDSLSQVKTLGVIVSHIKTQPKAKSRLSPPFQVIWQSLTITEQGKYNEN